MSSTNAERQAAFRARMGSRIKEIERAVVAPKDTGRSFVRAFTARALCEHAGGGRTPAQIAEENWPGDTTVQTIIRAATSPATMANTADLVASTTQSFVNNLGPASAGAALLAAGLQLTFDRGAGIIPLPRLPLPQASDASFVAEAAPIPVRQALFDFTTLTPSKFGTIISFNREVFEHSTPNIEQTVTAVLRDSVGLSLDAALFDTTVASATRPAGLRYQVTETQHEGTLTGNEAFLKDLTNLVTAVAPVAGNGQITFVMSPKQAATARMRRQPDFPYPILASSALAAGVVVCVANNALASAISAPRFESVADAVLNLDDTSPAHIGVGGSLAAGSTISLWQRDTLALKLVLPVAWGMRVDGAISWTSGVTW